MPDNWKMFKILVLINETFAYTKLYLFQIKTELFYERFVCWRLERRFCKVLKIGAKFVHSINHPTFVR